MLLTASPSNGSWNNVVNISGTIEAIAAILNILLVVYFFLRDKQEFRDREKERIKEQAYDKWYNLLVLERMLETLDIFFKDIESVVSRSKQGNGIEMVELISGINEIKNIISRNKRIFIPILALFSEELKQDVWNTLQESNDQILSEYEQFMYGKQSKNTIYEIINETKTTTYKKLYEYNLKKLREIIEDERKN